MTLLVDGEIFGIVDGEYMSFDGKNVLIFDGENGLFDGEDVVNFDGANADIDGKNVDSDAGIYFCGNGGEIFFCSGVGNFDRDRDRSGNVDGDVFDEVSGVLRGKSLDGENFIFDGGNFDTFVGVGIEFIVVGDVGRRLFDGGKDAGIYFNRRVIWDVG